MWLISGLVFLANPVIGAVLLFSAAVTTGLKVAKVDAQYAAKGETPPSHRLVEKWLEGRKDRGQAPKTAKVAKPGMWRYAWQRWQAMWEDLGETFTDTRDRYKQAKADAKANGTPPPDKPTFKETLKGWQWQLDQPVAVPKAEQAAGTDESRPAGPKVAAPLPPTAGPQNFQPFEKKCPRCSEVVTSKHPVSGDIAFDRHTQQCQGKQAPAATSRRYPDGFESGLKPLPIDDGPNCYEDPRVQAQARREAPTCPLCQQPMRLTEPGYSSQARYRCEPCGIGQGGRQWYEIARGLNEQQTSNNEGELMPAAAANGQSGEVTGIPSAINYLEQVAKAHEQYGAEGEILTAAMTNMKIGAGDIGLVQAAAQQSLVAAQLHQTAAKSITVSNAAVREAYGSAREAADKRHQLAE